MADARLTSVTVTAAARYTAEGTAVFAGEALRWMAYFKRASDMRVMLSRETAPGDWRWYPPEYEHGARAAILPHARRAIAGAGYASGGGA